MGKIEVEVVQCGNLASPGPSFVSLQLEKQKETTAQIPHNFNPAFGERFTLDVASPAESVLRLKVLDASFKSPKLLGFASLSFAGCPQAVDTTKVLDLEGAASGTVTVNVKPLDFFVPPTGLTLRMGWTAKVISVRPTYTRKSRFSSQKSWMVLLQVENGAPEEGDKGHVQTWQVQRVWEDLVASSAALQSSKVDEQRAALFRTPLPSRSKLDVSSGPSTISLWLRQFYDQAASWTWEHDAIRSLFTHNWFQPNNLNWLGSRIVHQGVLSRTGSAIGGKRLYGAVADDVLFIYKKEGDTNPQFLIELSATRVEATAGSNTSRFTLFYEGERTTQITYEARSEVDRDQWIKAIRSQQDAVKAKESQVGVLTLRVVGATNVRCADPNGYSDVYVMSACAGQQHTTPIRFKTLNPSFPSTLYRFENVRLSAAVRLIVLDWDKIGAPDFLGQLYLPLSSLKPEEPTSIDLPLTGRIGDKKPVEGSVQLVVELVTDSSAGSMAGGGGSSGHRQFHVPLESNRPPAVFLDCVQRMRDRDWLSTEGLFRISGAMGNIRVLRAQYDAGEGSLPEDTPVHDVAGLLKLWFRELVEPLLTFDRYSKFLAVDCNNATARVEAFSTLLGELPTPNRNVLRVLFAFLRDVAKFSSVNLMTKENLAIVFGPTLLRARVDSLDGVMHMIKINQVSAHLIVDSASILGTELEGVEDAEATTVVKEDEEGLALV